MLNGKTKGTRKTPRKQQGIENKSTLLLKTSKDHQRMETTGRFPDSEGKVQVGKVPSGKVLMGKVLMGKVQVGKFQMGKVKTEKF